MNDSRKDAGKRMEPPKLNVRVDNDVDEPDAVTDVESGAPQTEARSGHGLSLIHISEPTRPH